MDLTPADRIEAAEQWRAWWRILWAQIAAPKRQTLVPPEPPLFGLPVMYFADPPEFGSLAPTPA